jgi:K+-sensing histidine kinase KdpD
LRVIKHNTLRYESFYKSLPYLTGTDGSGKGIGLNNAGRQYPDNTPITSQLNKLKTLFDNLFSFQKKINDFDDSDISGITFELEDAVKRIIPCRDINIFLLEDSKIVPLSKSAPEYSVNFINNAYKEGILDWVFEDINPKVIPDLKLYNIKGSRLNYIIYPLKSEKKNKGLLSILSSLSALPENSIESKIIQFIATTVFSKIDSIKKTNELKSAYQDQQIYQSKLLNDYKLSAIGELTNGIVEEILSPLQVIMSEVDFLRKENSEVTKTEFDTIKEQVKKVERIVTRLVKFASINNDNIKVYPCDLNKLIKNFHNILSSTLKNINYESYLDLADNLPPVLSNPDYIYQILSNIISLINTSPDNEVSREFSAKYSENKNSGGILIQTRYKDKKINVRIVFTNQIRTSNNGKDTYQYNLRIADNLMKKHEGELHLFGNEINGSVIVLTFPLQRKIKL